MVVWWLYGDYDGVIMKKTNDTWVLNGMVFPGKSWDICQRCPMVFYHPTMGDRSCRFSCEIPWGFVRVSPWVQVHKKYWTQSPFLKPRCSWCLVPLHWPSSRRKWSPLLPIPDSQHTLRSSDCRFLGWRTISNHANGYSSRIASFRICRHFETASREIPHIKMRST